MTSRNRARVLHIIGLAALFWVSVGSYQIVVRSGVNPWLALLYPLIVDAGVVAVMPYSNNAALPFKGEWPVRRNARTTLLLAFVAIGFFNVLNAILDAAGAGARLPAWVMPSVAVVAGIVPVVLYFRLMGLHALATSYETEQGKRAVEAERVARERAEQQARDAEDARREREAADLREARRAEEEHAREMERIRVQTEAEVARETAKASNGTSRVHKRVTNATASRFADVPGETAKDKLAAIFTREWAEGRNPNPTQTARELGVNPSYGRMVKAHLAKQGIYPPEERPSLTLAASDR